MENLYRNYKAIPLNHLFSYYQDPFLRGIDFETQTSLITVFGINKWTLDKNTKWPFWPSFDPLLTKILVKISIR